MQLGFINKATSLIFPVKLGMIYKAIAFRFSVRLCTTAIGFAFLVWFLSQPESSLNR